MTNYSSRCARCIAATIVVAAGISSLATVLTFDGAGDGNASSLNQAYGSRVTSATMGSFGYGSTGGFTPNVTVTYGPSAATIQFWTTGYGDLDGVILDRSNPGTGLSVTFTADQGFLVRLHSWQMAAFPRLFLEQDRAAVVNQVTVTVDGAAAPSFPRSQVLIATNGHTSFDFSDAPFVGQQITVAFDSSNLGDIYAADDICFDNITISQADLVARYEFSVDAATMAMDTGLILDPGSIFQITATGFWTHDPNVAAYDANGFAYPWGPPAILGTAKMGALIGKVGNEEWFNIGASKIGQTTAGGRLTLSMNDDPAGFFNNAGSLSVTVRMLNIVSLKISPPITVAEHSTNGYACTAEFSDGTSRDVSTEAQWSISPVLPGFRINAGQLEAGNVSADTLVKVSAEYGGKSDVREVLVVAAKAELVEYYLASAQAPLTMNVGMVGAALFPPTSCEDATSEVAGNQITYTLKTPGSVLQDIQPSPYTWGAGERALQRQVSFLNVPVYVFDPVQGYCDCSITGRDGEGVVIDRKRAMVSKIQGRFRVKPALNDVTLEAQAYGYLDSYTLAGIMADIDLVNTGFQAIRQGLKYGVRKAIEKGLEGYVPGKVVDVLVDPVSEYEGQLTMTLVGGGAGVEREVLYVFPLTENYLGVSREVGEESVSSAPFEVGDGELVQWELDLESYVRTHGYGRAAATFDTFEVRILHKGEVIGTVNSGYRPRALTASAVAKTERPQYGPTPEAAAMGSGIEALGAFNNLFFETEVNTNLTTGNVVLLPHAGPVAPTDGRAFTLIEGSNNVAGFVTLIHLPLDAQTLSLDTRFLAGTTNGLLTNALLAVAVWDTNGMGAGMDILPAIDEMQGFAPPYGGYAFASEWRTASLSVTGMQGPVYLAVFLDTESATNEVLAVALDALRVSDLPQERPFLAHRWDETAPALELSWPTNANRFVLRSAETLDAGYWMRVLEPATRTGTNWVISLPPSATNRFFRLQFD